MAQRQSVKLIDNLDLPVIEPLKTIYVPNNNVAGDVVYRQVTPNEAGNFGFQQTKIATFDVSDQIGAWDLSQSTINGQILLATGTTACFDSSANAIISRMRLLTANNVVLEDKQFYNVLNAAEKACTASAVNCTQNWKSWADGAALAEASKSQVTASAQYFEIPIDLSFAKIQKIAHLPVIGGLKLELTFETDLNICSSSDSATPKFTIQNLRLNCRLIPMTADYIQELRKQAARGQLLYNTEGLYVENQSWAQANNSFQINLPMKSVHSLLARFYLSGDVSTQTKKYLGKSQYLTAFTSIQLQHGSDAYPTNAIDNPFTAYKYLQELFNIHNDTDSANLITRANYVAADSNGVDAPQFYVGIDLTSGGMNTGLDLSNSRAVFRTINTAVSNLYCQVFVWYSQVIQVFSAGDVQVFST